MEHRADHRQGARRSRRSPTRAVVGADDPGPDYHNVRHRPLLSRSLHRGDRRSVRPPFSRSLTKVVSSQSSTCTTAWRQSTGGSAMPARSLATGSLQQGRGSGPTRARAYDTKQRWLAAHRGSSGSLAAPEARALDLERWTMDPRGHPDRPLAHPKRVTQRRLACH